MCSDVQWIFACMQCKLRPVDLLIMNRYEMKRHVETCCELRLEVAEFSLWSIRFMYVDEWLLLFPINWQHVLFPPMQSINPELMVLAKFYCLILLLASGISVRNLFPSCLVIQITSYHYPLEAEDDPMGLLGRQRLWKLRSRSKTLGTSIASQSPFERRVKRWQPRAAFGKAFEATVQWSVQSCSIQAFLTVHSDFAARVSCTKSYR